MEIIDAEVGPLLARVPPGVVGKLQNNAKGRELPGEMMCCHFHLI
jgi:hypothetical protein